VAMNRTSRARGGEGLVIDLSLGGDHLVEGPDLLQPKLPTRGWLKTCRSTLAP
jgi:hypothetical protein